MYLQCFHQRSISSCVSHQNNSRLNFWQHIWERWRTTERQSEERGNETHAHTHTHAHRRTGKERSRRRSSPGGDVSFSSFWLTAWGYSQTVHLHHWLRPCIEIGLEDWYTSSGTCFLQWIIRAHFNSNIKKEDMGHQCIWKRHIASNLLKHY